MEGIAVERQKLTMRTDMKRYERRTNAHSKKFENHVYQVALYSLFYNFCRIHHTVRHSPAMEAGLTDKLHDVEWIADLADSD